MTIVLANARTRMEAGADLKQGMGSSVVSSKRQDAQSAGQTTDLRRRPFPLTEYLGNTPWQVPAIFEPSCRHRPGPFDLGSLSQVA